MFCKRIFLLVSLSLSLSFSFSQQQTKIESIYNPQETFAQNFYTKNGNEFRSANGSPGAKYWQNRADYNLQATMDTVKNELSCNEIIHYTNNSPDALQSLWVQLDQNTYRADARSNFYSTFGATQHTDGYEFENVFLEINGKTIKADYIINDTRMQLRLSTRVSIKRKNKY